MLHEDKERVIRYVIMCVSHFIFLISFRLDGNHGCTTWDRQENSHGEIFYKSTYGVYHVRNIANNSVVPNIGKVWNFEVSWGTFYIENVYEYSCYLSCSNKDNNNNNNNNIRHFQLSAIKYYSARIRSYDRLLTSPASQSRNKTELNCGIINLYHVNTA
jgi:hypothetical protein